MILFSLAVELSFDAKLLILYNWNMKLSCKFKSNFFCTVVGGISTDMQRCFIGEKVQVSWSIYFRVWMELRVELKLTNRPFTEKPASRCIMEIWNYQVYTAICSTVVSSISTNISNMQRCFRCEKGKVSWKLILQGEWIELSVKHTKAF